jgi:hypothetical protein
MYALTAPENQALNLLTRPNSKNNVAAFSKSMENAITTMVSQGFNESDLRAAAKGILLGKQPIEKLELKLFQTALDDIDKRVTSGELKPGKNFGARTLPWVKSASSVTAARLSGELPMAEQMRLDLNAASQSASPSKVTKQAAKNMVDGVTEGIVQAKPAVRAAANMAMEEALLASAGGMPTSASEGLATETSGGLAATSRPGGRFAKFQAARMATRAKLTSRLPKFMTGKFAGLGMGLGLQVAGQFASPYIDKLPGGSIANDAITGASYGAFLGPEGAAAGAAIGGIIGGISKLMNMEKLHKANAEATFKASASAADMFGGSVHQNNIPLIDLSKTIDSALPKVTAIKDATKGFVESINSMKDDNPMKLIFNQMKDANDTKAAAIAESFAATQVAVGNLDPAQADKMIQLYLAATGHSAIAATTSGPKDLTAATAAVLSAPGKAQGLTAADKVNLAQQQAILNDPAYAGTAQIIAQNNITAIQQKATGISGQLAKNIVTVGSAMLDSGSTLDQYNQRMAAIQQKLGGSTQASKVFVDGIVKNKIATSKTGEAVKALNLPLSDTINYFKLATLNSKSPLLEQLLAAKPGSDDMAKILKSIADSIVTISKTKPTVDPTLNADGSAKTADQIAADRVSALQKQYKPLLDQESKRTTELEKQKALMDAQNTAAQDAINYATQQTDVQNQIRKAMAGGDYLQANLLRQQMAGNADKYNQTVIANKNQQMIDQGREMYAAAQEKIANGQSLTKAEVSALKGYNPKLGTYNVGSVNMPSAVQYGTAASMGTAAGSQPVVNMVFNDTGKFTQEQLQAIVDNAFKKNGITAKMSGTSSKVGG